MDKKSIFVVHGRDRQARDSMFTFLRAIDLKPLEWDEAKNLTPGANPYVGDILANAFSYAEAILVLFTPDDEAKLRDLFIQDIDENYEKKLTPQARPNVLFEAGMAIGYNPQKTILVEMGKLRPFSDIYGRHTIRLNNSAQSKMSLINALKKVGLDVDIEGRTDYLGVDLSTDERLIQYDETDSGRLSRMSDDDLTEQIPEKTLTIILNLLKKILMQSRKELIWHMIIDRLTLNNAMLKQAMIYIAEHGYFEHEAYVYGIETLSDNNQAEFYNFMKRLYRISPKQFNSHRKLLNDRYSNKMDEYIKNKQY